LRWYWSFSSKFPYAKNKGSYEEKYPKKKNKNKKMRQEKEKKRNSSRKVFT
jgi:hypothetical protein